LLQLINGRGDPDKHRFLTLFDFFYFKEHLFIVTELLRENLYEFGNYINENRLTPYFTVPRIGIILKQVYKYMIFDQFMIL